VISTGTPAIDALIVGIALLGGYLVGSIPLAGRIAGSAGHDPGIEGAGKPGSASAWNAAGPGWELLALTGELAKGVVPVAVGIVTWSWSIGWVPGLGALLGACWPAFGRLPGGPGVAVLGGVVFTLPPPAGVVRLVLAGLVLAMGSLLGRNARIPAVAAGAISYPVVFLALEQDLAQLGAVLVLALVVAVRRVTTRDR
jgi:glycerol-3-phosphate acyltransferase PlsY